MRAVLAEYLAPKHALVLLDNLEQVIDAAPDIGTLLGSAPGLDILLTSREPLSIAGEHVYQVPPLGLPAEPGVPKRVARGGSYLSSETNGAAYRPAARLKFEPTYSASDLGFRCTRSKP